MSEANAREYSMAFSRKIELALKERIVDTCEAVWIIRGYHIIDKF